MIFVKRTLTKIGPRYTAETVYEGMAWKTSSNKFFKCPYKAANSLLTAIEKYEGMEVCFGKNKEPLLLAK